MTHFDAKLVQQCETDFIFDETKQECAKPTTKEDFDCLFLLENKSKMMDSKLETFKLIGRNLSDFMVANISHDEKISTFVATNRFQQLNKNNQILETTDYEYSDEQNPPNEQKENELESNEVESEHKRICIVTNWSQFRPGQGRFRFEDINPIYCNHIMFSSVSIGAEDDNDSKFTVKPIRQNDYSKNIKFKFIYKTYFE